jgi:hypothetical protein
MNSIYLTFQKYQDPELAKEIARLLHENKIEFEIEDHNQFFDPSFANNKVDPNIILKLKPEDFKRADYILHKYYAQQLDSVDKEYYLFDFSDDELEEIISKPDEWGKFDYQLAQRILKERGKEVNPNEIEYLKIQRINDLSKPEATSKFWIILGYVSAILGGVLGFIIGWVLAHFKKTLPNGQRVYNYVESVRKHGKIIFYLSFVGLILWIARNFSQFFSN